MRRISCILFFVLLILVMESCTSANRRYRPLPTNKATKSVDSKQFAVIKKKVVLLPFFNEAPYGGDDLGITATEEYRRELSRTGEFVIDIEGQKLFGASKEIYSGAGLKLGQLARKAKMSGVNFVVLGRIKIARVRQKGDEIGVVREMKSFAESQIEVRVYDVNANKEIFTQDFDSTTDDKSYQFFNASPEDNIAYRQELLRYAVKVAVRRSVPKIIEMAAKLEWTGRVAKIIGTKIYINAGREAGINMGDVLKVMTEGNEIYDPETGALIGMSKGELKGTLEVVDYFGPDGSVCILHSGGTVTEGDFVQLY